jgi:membrane protein implicated in regulation of membrane protease activity
MSEAGTRRRRCPGNKPPVDGKAPRTPAPLLFVRTETAGIINHLPGHRLPRDRARCRMPEEFWWIWMTAAAVLVVVEIVVPGFFFIWFGIGAVAAGVATLLGVGPVGQLGVLTLVSGILLVLSRKIAQRITKPQPPGIGADRLKDATGVVVESVDPARNTGMVLIDREEWRATSETGHTITKGTKIQVVRREGTHVIVTVLKEETE